ncbi:MULTISPECIES: hypothetical protein [Pirellulaceae]|uniref:Uncharacterized protein n=1 Tax=Aporhodopirellula rubra TaxID=980271 RepID=A0A7W5E3K1_9BACT|nr:MULTISPECIES: hypothetical protein [Pirellulaceae]EMI43925.1 hypothetical protein RRSWK_03528 [Rhodopirellula sp. SWK7]MBB3209566.1 hypothetical protein [Aporhodopirellula rubra]
MKCHELAEHLSRERPDLPAIEIARLCLILLNAEDSAEQLADSQKRMAAWQHASFRFEAATDQYAAVVDELDQLFGDEPIQFRPDQLWTLLRAVKVQSQMLELYTNEMALA